GGEKGARGSRRGTVPGRPDGGFAAGGNDPAGPPHCQAPPPRGAVARRNRRLAELSLRVVQADIEFVNQRADLVRRFPDETADIEPRAETLWQPACEHDGEHVFVGCRSVQGRDQGAHRGQIERVDRRAGAPAPGHSARDFIANGIVRAFRRHSAILAHPWIAGIAVYSLRSARSAFFNSLSALPAIFG